MSIYLIHAYEGRYSGLYGIEDWNIVTAANLKQAKDIARDMSIDVIESYIDDELYNEAEEEPEYSETEVDELYDELIEEEIAYDIWELDSKYTIEQYDKMLEDNDYEVLIQYGVERG